MAKRWPGGRAPCCSNCARSTARSPTCKQGKGGTVFLGAVTAPAIELAVPAIRRIRKNFPRIEISMQVETSAVLARELLASRHDFIIARIPDDLNPRLFDARVIGIEKACLIVRRGIRWPTDARSS